jgi:hypothetical protein
MKRTKAETEWELFRFWVQTVGLQERALFFAENFITDARVNPGALAMAIHHDFYIQTALLAMGQGKELEDSDDD